MVTASRRKRLLYSDLHTQRHVVSAPFARNPEVADHTIRPGFGVCHNGERAGPLLVVPPARCVILDTGRSDAMMPSAVPPDEPPISDLQPISAATIKIDAAIVEETRAASLWVARITRIVGAACLLLALVEWAGRPGHLRTVLALLTIALFAAILHSYTFEDVG